MEKRPSLPKLIHAATIRDAHGKCIYLLLRQEASNHLAWFENHVASPISGITLAEAIAKGRKHWQAQGFSTLGCGFRYTLPERDEHGCNALFHQMIASYSSSNGVYFDEELGHNCFVNYASLEARNLWEQLKRDGYN